MKTSQLELQIERFIESLIRRNLSEHTRRAYRADLGSFLDCFPAPVIAKIRLADIRVWLASLYDRKLAAVSIRRHISALRTFFQFLTRQGLIAANPVQLLCIPKMPHTLPSFLTAKQTSKLIDGVEAMERRKPLRDLAVFELLYGCGLRVGELVGLNLRDVDRQECWLLIRGKGKTERRVPYGGKAKDALERYLVYRVEYLARPRRPVQYNHATKGYTGPRTAAGRVAKRVPPADPLEPALFLNGSRKRLDVRSVGNIVKGYGLRVLGDGDIHPHALRHAYATDLMDNGAGIREVQELLGHVSLSSTQIYTQVSLGGLMKGYDDAHPRSGK